MKKNFVLIFCLFWLCGCSVEYELDLNNYLKYNESIKISPINNEEKKLLGEFKNFIPVDYHIDEIGAFENEYSDLTYYNYKLNNNGSLIVNHSHDLDSYASSRFINTCYDYVTVMEEKSSDGNLNLILSTSNKFKCFDNYDDLDNVNVTIKTDYKLIESNADSINNGSYTWRIDRSNKDNKYIYLSIDVTQKEEKNLFKKILNSNLFGISVMFIILFSIIVLILSFLKTKSNLNNKI